MDERARSVRAKGHPCTQPRVTSTTVLDGKQAQPPTPPPETHRTFLTAGRAYSAGTAPTQDSAQSHNAARPTSNTMHTRYRRSGQLCGGNAAPPPFPDTNIARTSTADHPSEVTITTTHTHAAQLSIHSANKQTATSPFTPQLHLGGCRRGRLLRRASRAQPAETQLVCGGWTVVGSSWR